MNPDDRFLATMLLYECRDGYRVHETLWSASGRPTECSLYPVIGYLGYGTYTEQEAREKWGEFFEAL